MTYDAPAPAPAPRDSIVRTGSDRTRPVSKLAVSTDTQLISQAGLFMGYSVRENTGSAPAVIQLYDGSSTGGTLFMSIGLGNGGSSTVWFGDDGIDIESGVTAHLIIGSADITLFFNFDIGYGQ